MTPRTVLTALRKGRRRGRRVSREPNLTFGRLPVYGRNLDDIVGLVRRRDLLKAKANNQDTVLVESLMHDVQFVPETASVANAMEVCLRATSGSSSRWTSLARRGRHHDWRTSWST